MGSHNEEFLLPDISLANFKRFIKAEIVPLPLSENKQVLGQCKNEADDSNSTKAVDTFHHVHHIDDTQSVANSSEEFFQFLFPGGLTNTMQHQNLSKIMHNINNKTYNKFVVPSLHERQLQEHGLSKSEYEWVKAQWNMTWLQSNVIKQELLDDDSRTNFPTKHLYPNNHNVCQETHTRNLPNIHHDNSDEVNMGVILDDKQDHMCEMCGNMFPTEEMLGIHISIDHELNPGLCELCGRTFATSLLMNSHLAVHEEQPWKLDIEEEIQQEFILPNHTVHEEQSLKLDIKEEIQEITILPDLAAHVEQPWKLDVEEEIQEETILPVHAAHEEQSWQLDTEEETQEKTTLLEHASVNEIDLNNVLDKEQDNEEVNMTISELLGDILCQLDTSSAVTGTTPIQRNYQVPQKKELVITICDLCGKELKSKSSKERHRRCGQRPHKCRYCSKSFGTRYYVQVHERIHTGDKPFACVQCGMTFISNPYLQSHKEIAHVETESFICDELNCGKTFPTKARLKCHVKNHENHKFMCEQCGKQFTTANYLRIHCLTHSDASFTCEVCGKVFKVQLSLKRHIKHHHEGKKRLLYSCTKCDKTLLTKEGLVLHMNWHTGEKPFKCTFCPRHFANRNTRKVHERTHTGERPFQCQVCSQTFTQSHVLKSHQKKCS